MTEQQSGQHSPKTDSNSQSNKFSFGNTGGGGSANSEKIFEDQDPFFSAGAKKNKRFRPRLSEKLFGNQTSNSKHPFFTDPQAYFEDLRKDFGKKMFFDDVDSFGFPSEPQPAGAGSHRARRTGFPFDDIRPSSARSRLDDLASRHPMFSSMGSPNSWQDTMGDNMGRWGQRGRNNSGGAGSTCSSGAASGSSTASCGEEHVIPIKIVQGGNSASGTTASNSSASSNSNNTDTNGPPEPPRRKHQPLGPQRSATDNSCQKPTGETLSAQAQGRSQRAQSAPPDGTPVGQPNTPQATQLGGNTSKSKQSAGSGVRHIPIFVEGRDSPVVPTEESGRSPSQQQHQSQNVPVYNSAPPKSSRPAEHSPTPPPKKPTPPKDPLEKIQAVSDEVKLWEGKVNEAEGGNSRKDKNYIYLDEMLTRNLIKLDDVETEGRDDIRTARKDCIKLINSCIALLEAKFPLPPSENGTQMEMEENSMAIVPFEENPSKEQTSNGNKIEGVTENSSGIESPNV